MDQCIDTAIFGFEAGMAGTLKGIPMSVRMKLDLCGLKISLAQWRGLPLAVRQVMMEVRCDTVGEIQRARRYFRFIVGAFGLVKLTRQGHIRYLKGAIEEFGLLTRRERPSV